MTDNRKTPEPGGVYRWYAWPGPRNMEMEFDRKLLHIAIPSSVSEGAVRVFTSNTRIEPWTQGYVPADAVLMIPADRGVDVPPGQPRVIIRELPEKLDLTKIEHRQVFDRALSDAVTADPVPAVVEAVAVVRGAVSTAGRRAREAQRMVAFREEAKQMLEGTVEQRIERIAELMRQAEDGPEDEDDY